MNILMLYPKFPTTFWNPEHYSPNPPIHDTYTMAPLGLLTIASYLPSDFQIRLVDRNVSEESATDWEWADVIFLSLMCAQYDDYQICVANARNHQKSIAVGGPFTNAMPEAALGDADWVCFGEAENVMEELVQDLREDRRGKRYDGGNQTDMETVKIPRFDLLPDINAYSHTPVQFSRGCPFNCEFCDIIEIYGRIPRTKRPSQILEELRSIKQLGFRGSVFLVDDNFIGNKRKAKEMLEELAVWNRDNRYPYLFVTEASINLADEEPLLDAMARANFMSVFIGIETPDPKLLKTTQKMQNIPGDPLKKLQKIRNHGINVLAGFILGFDGEDRNVFEMQRSFLQASGIGIAMIGLLQAIPHTQLSRRLKKEGRLLEKIQVKVVPTLEGINFIPKGEITKREYLQQYARLAQELYQPKMFFERMVRGHLDLRQKLKLPRNGVNKSHLRSFFQDMSHIAFRMRGTRRYFWASFFKILWKNPSALLAFCNECCWFPYLKKHANDNVRREITSYLSNPPLEDILDRVIPSDEFLVVNV